VRSLQHRHLDDLDNFWTYTESSRAIPLLTSLPAPRFTAVDGDVDVASDKQAMTLLDTLPVEKFASWLKRATASYNQVIVSPLNAKLLFAS
jgi:hypothetical protein